MNVRAIVLSSLLTTALGCEATARPPDPAPGDPAPGDPAPAGTVSDQTRADADRHVGRYRFSGGAAERDAVDAAIEDVVADMNILSRSIARDKLRESNRVPERITIERTGDDLAITIDERRYAASLDGTSIEVESITGEIVDYRIDVSAARVRQSFAGKRGGRRNDLRRTDSSLRLDVEVSSPSLPKPLRYRLTYRAQ